MTLCGGNHYWVWAGDPNYPLPDGYPCACGQMLWHKEKCSCCGNEIIKPLVMPLKKNEDDGLYKFMNNE